MFNSVIKTASLIARGLAATAATAAILLAIPAQAGGDGKKPVWEQQVGQWSDAKVAPETRSRCKNTTSGTWPWGGKWKACKQWSTEARVMEMHSTLVVRGPRDLAKPEKKLAEQCSGLAAAAAAQVEGGDPLAAQAAAQATFRKCADHHKLADPGRFDLNVEVRNSWSDWH